MNSDMRSSLVMLLLFLMLSGCGDFNAEAMFKSHGISVKQEEIHNLRGGKVSCLHCPMYFMFDTKPELVEKFISEHQLQQVRTLSPEIREIVSLVEREASWWQLGNPTTQDKVYWIHFSPKQPELESAFRLLVVQNMKTFFVTSGHFNPADYHASLGTK